MTEERENYNFWDLLREALPPELFDQVYDRMRNGIDGWRYIPRRCKRTEIFRAGTLLSEGKSYAEVARKLNRSDMTIRRYQARYLEIIRKYGGWKQ